ncbi:MAG: hypothetical protein HUK24_07285, partial [Sphaerochaetaceae bacterium]|nr:hypothetical protein [Sphaerochaetaceae bacterium]
TQDNYYVNQIIGLASIIGDDKNSKGKIQNDIKLTVEVTSGQWCFVYNGTDTTYMRPFGLQLVAKCSTDAYGYAQYEYLKEYNAYIGEQNNSVTKKTITIPKDKADDYAGIYWDIVLVFATDVAADNTVPSVANNSYKYNLIKSDYYYSATLKITIECGSAKREETLYLKGYYGDKQDDAETCTLSITRMPSASTLNLTTLFGQTEPTTVAYYNFYTSSTINSNGKVDAASKGTFKVLLSSSNSVLTQTDEFLLRHVQSNGAYELRDTNHNAVKFKAYLISDDVNKGRNSSNTSSTKVEFDGKGYVNQKTNGTITGNYLEIVPSNYKNQESANAYMYRWENSGCIAIEIPENQTIDGQPVTLDGLVAGQYKSNIYIHVISDINTK